MAFAETLWDLGKPKFAGSFQNQGKRLLAYLPLRLYEIRRRRRGVEGGPDLGGRRRSVDLIRRR